MYDLEACRRRYEERLVKEIGDANRDRVASFVRLKHSQGKTTNTRCHYAAWLDKLDDHLNGRRIESLTEEDATRFLSGLRGSGYGADSVKGAATCVKADVTWALVLEKLPPRMRQALHVDKNRRIEQRPTVSGPGFAAFVGGLGHWMDQAFAALLWESGFRMSDALSLNVGSFEFDDRGGCWLSIPKDGYDLKTGPRAR